MKLNKRDLSTLQELLSKDAKLAVPISQLELAEKQGCTRVTMWNSFARLVSAGLIEKVEGYCVRTDRLGEALK